MGLDKLITSINENKNSERYFLVQNLSKDIRNLPTVSLFNYEIYKLSKNKENLI